MATGLVLLVHNTTLLPSEPNASLPQEKGQATCASLCVMDPDGMVIARPAATLTAIREAIGAGKRLLALRQTTSQPKQQHRKELFLLELKLGLLSIDSLTARIDGLELTAEESELVKNHQTDLLVQDLQQRANTLGPAQVAASIHALASSGARPTTATSGTFWLHVLMHCAQCGDGRLADAACQALSQPLPTGLGPTPEQLARWQRWRAQAHQGSRLSEPAR